MSDQRIQIGIASYVVARTPRSQNGKSNLTATSVIPATVSLQGKVPNETDVLGTMEFRIGTTDRNPGELSYAPEGFVILNQTNGNAFQSIGGKWCALGPNLDDVDPTLLDRWFSTTPTYAQWGATVDPFPPILHYKLNDNAANKIVVDTMGNLDGQWVYRNTSVSTTTGILNFALTFDGTNDYLDIPDNVFCNGPALSVALWVKNTSTTINWDRVISKKTNYGDSNGYEVTLDGSNSSTIYISGSSGTWATIDSGVNWPDNIWHHLVIVWDANIVSLYVDGRFKGSGAIDSIVSNINSLKFGKITSETATMWQGLMDDIRVYNSAISQTIVTALYNEGSGTEGNNIVNEMGYHIGTTDRQIGEIANAPENFYVYNITNGNTFKVVGGVWT